MNKETIQKLFRRFVNHETISYVIFGVLTTLVSIGSYWICILPYGSKPPTVAVVTATVISWIISVSFAYVTNKLFVFNSKNSSAKDLLKEISSFFLCRLFSGAFEVIFMVAAVDFLHINDKAAKIFTQFVIVIANYVFSKLFIFQKKM